MTAAPSIMASIAHAFRRPATATSPTKDQAHTAKDNASLLLLPQSPVASCPVENKKKPLVSKHSLACARM